MDKKNFIKKILTGSYDLGDFLFIVNQLDMLFTGFLTLIKKVGIGTRQRLSKAAFLITHYKLKKSTHYKLRKND